MNLFSTLLLVWFVLLDIPASANEAFPGQLELAKGISCYSELDLNESLSHLQKAVANLSPEKDPDYMQHMRTARWIIVLIHVASDDLQRAEKELTTLLLLDPGFELPPGDHPPKVRYVFQQAKEKIKKKESSTPAIKAPANEHKPKKNPFIKTAPDSGTRILLGVTGSVVLLFGEDAKAASSGPGMTILFGYRLAPKISATAELEYSYHPTSLTGIALQTAALRIGAEVCVLSKPLDISIGADLGALGMGTQDRYDHWGFNLAGSLTLAWPPSGTWAMIVKLQPSVVITSSNASFYLPVCAGAEARW